MRKEAESKRELVLSPLFATNHHPHHSQTSLLHLTQQHYGILSIQGRIYQLSARLDREDSSSLRLELEVGRSSSFLLWPSSYGRAPSFQGQLMAGGL